MIGQCGNFHGINSTVEIACVFIILADYCLHHLANNVAINTHDYIRMDLMVANIRLLAPLKRRQ